ncbi:DNA polymerase-3 subunit gamma/tau [Chitinophaga costaii]|uniref:DNA polymerase III subunit gamma/tau n=1 Tax=Chitinophaga costaii TaxID=1335309 RepID=A0A1C4BN77_9BACT|nr:DNA polymerase III subunit gamma/tau [Chitinophaga costaii]PUZ27539.1 DNA polymerase III subunit gamma/tau [Chitinophaga costaii]SCC08335.1 DNA polymerase-3 subunit gamma/tau [Chitinophaga costaii]
MEHFIVSARKYRPQNFSTVVGQAHITTTLKNAIRNNQLAHAFLFCGPRGVGKTTCARILAKTINCENLQPDGEACNECHSCVSFNDGASFNIHELDAASNNSVDDIRTLVEQVRFAPQAGKYKIYIIDEVHMLSSSAFNAFLKTLEEPPSYAIFILATTEKHKILPTILSRCQIFDFKRITIQDTVDHLAEICQKEHIEAEPDALHLVAQKTDGCMRDSLSTLDKIVSFTAGHLTYSNTLEHLNILDYDYFFKVMEAVLAQDVAQAMLIFDEILQKGFEGDNFLNGWSEFLRNLLLCKEDKVQHLVEVSGNLRERYKQLSVRVSPAYLITALHLLNETEINYRLARNKRLHVEMALIKLCFLQQAITLSSDDSGEVVKKKLVPDGSIPQKLRAPFARAISPKAGQPATTQSIAQQEARLTIETPKTPTAPAPPANVPAHSNGTQPDAGSANIHTTTTRPITVAATEPNYPGTAAQNTAGNPTPATTRPATTAPAGNAKLTGLAAMKQAMAAQQSATITEERIPLTLGAIHVYWDEFIDRFRQANKMTVVSNFQLAVLGLQPPHEITMTSSNIVQLRFMEEEKLGISEFFKSKFKNPSLIVSFHLDESQAPADLGPVPLSSREQLAKMIEKYPLVKELKDRMNLELDI